MLMIVMRQPALVLCHFTQDAAHVNAFFRRMGIATLTTRELFDFAVDPAITPDRLDAALDALAHVAASRTVDAAAEEDAGVAAQACQFTLVFNRHSRESRASVDKPCSGLPFAAASWTVDAAT